MATAAALDAVGMSPPCAACLAVSAALEASSAAFLATLVALVIDASVGYLLEAECAISALEPAWLAALIASPMYLSPWLATAVAIRFASAAALDTIAACALA